MKRVPLPLAPDLFLVSELQAFPSAEEILAATDRKF